MASTLKSIWDGISRRLTFPFLAALVIVIQWPYIIDSSYSTQHDTFQYFNWFYAYYNHFFFHDNLMQWLPYQSFGIPANFYQFFTLTPFSYLAMALGKIFQVTNVMILFKFSVLAETLVYAMGLYRLAAHLFKRQSTILVTCLAGLYSISFWQSQLMYDFRFYSLLPFELLYLFKFFETKNPRNVIYMLFFGLVWLMGTVQYCAIIWIYVLLIMAAVLWAHEKKFWKQINPLSRFDWVLLAVFCLLSVGYLCQLKNLTQYADTLSRSDHMGNPLHVFMVQGGKMSLRKYFDSWILGRSFSGAYLGFVPFILFIWSLLYVHHKYFKASLAAIGFLVVLSLGGIGSVLLYFIPGMAIFRHIALLYGFIKVLMLIGVGMGLDHFCSTDHKRWLPLGGILFGLVFALDALRSSGDYLFDKFIESLTLGQILHGLNWRSPLAINLICLSGLGLAYLVIELLTKTKEKGASFQRLVMRYGFVCIILIDFFIFYQRYAPTQIPRVEKEVRPLLYLWDTHPLTFQPIRSSYPDAPLNQRQRDAAALINWDRFGGLYGGAHAVAQWDVCKTPYRVDFAMKGFRQLIATRQSVDESLLTTLGCFHPKLSLMNKVLHFKDEDLTQKAMTSIPDLQKQLILTSDLPHEFFTSSQTQSLSQDLGVFQVTDFNNNELKADVFVKNPDGAWLYDASSFHPAWHARVNGQDVPVVKAYLTFMALKLDPGLNKVHLYYENGWITGISYLFVGHGLIWAGIFMVMFVRLIIGQNRGQLPFP